ncbi:hypothetical protein SPFM7_00136 [Salmonella phage SPFM7]|nr:hypothetical protein SPFM7_00136 [Salmonella phage SPFM7]
MVIQTGIDEEGVKGVGPLNSNTVQDVPTSTAQFANLPQWAGLRKVLDDLGIPNYALTYGIDFTAYKNLLTVDASGVLNAIQEPISPSLGKKCIDFSATLRYNRGLPVLDTSVKSDPNYTNTQTIAALSTSPAYIGYGVNFSAIDIQNYSLFGANTQFVTFDAPNLHSAFSVLLDTVYYDRVNLARLLPWGPSVQARNTSARLRGIQGSGFRDAITPANCYVEKVTQVPVNAASNKNELVFDLINRDNPNLPIKASFNDLDDPSEV